MRSEKVESSCSSVLLSSPSCGETSRSVSTFSARRTSGTACSIEACDDTGPLWRPRSADRRELDEILVRDELVAVALHHQAREGAAADHEDLLVVLLQFLDERDEVAVAADDDVGVDVAVRERHLERVEREVDVGAVLVAAGREVALDQLRRVLRERAAVVPRARPVPVRDFRNDVAALPERFEDDPDVELHAQRALDPDLDVVEVDEYRNLQSCVCQNVLSSLREPLSRQLNHPFIMTDFGYAATGKRRGSTGLSSAARRTRKCCPGLG